MGERAIMIRSARIDCAAKLDVVGLFELMADMT